MSDIASQSHADELLSALGEQLAVAGSSYELVIIGGSALLAIGAISRATRDVDVLALCTGDQLIKPDPLPAGLVDAARRVALDFGLPADWLNTGPSSLLDLGLPDGFTGRMLPRRYGQALKVYFASRLDQIHFKLYAVVDQGPGKHEDDLRALDPNASELLDAARWARTHDPSPGFRDLLIQTLRHLGVENVDLGA